MPNEMKPTGAVRRLAAKAVDRKQWQVPNWAVWLGGFLIFLALAGLVYGTVQHFRVGRWTKLLKQSRKVIVQLNNQNTHLRAKAKGAYSKGTGEATSKAVRRLVVEDRKLVDRERAIDRRLRDAKAYKRRIKDDIDNSDVDSLLAKFAVEGFKGKIVVQPPPPARPTPPAKRKEPAKD